MTFNRQTLPVNDNVNPYAFSLSVEGELFIQKGKMIAYYGDLRFEALGSGPYSMMVKKSFNAPEYASQFAIVTGQGKLLLGDYGRNLTSFDLEDGNLTVRAANVLAFDKTLTCQECVLPGYITLLGSGRFIVSSNGPVHFMEPPVRVDEDAILGWADMPCPSFRYDYAAITNVLQLVGGITGATSTGEEKQLDFFGKGTVLVQSSEAQLSAPNQVAKILGMLPGINDADLRSVQAAVSLRLQRQ